ncbi:N-lysine methyltransferase setd6 [Lepisosteus oculatus]|uniref:N-lysine methyltransferase setd6 n=1 Tax=Lepisosteus oculatus TaxID=7918 RepID=UPI0035F50938
MASDAKKPKLDSGGLAEGCVDEPLQNFLSWCEDVGLKLSAKVCVSKQGTVSEYGMLAREEIKEGEVIFSIPRTALLYQETSRVKSVLEKEKQSLSSPSGWVPLLLALMWEYTCPDSYWRPYLSLWPDLKALDHPMFWSEEERNRLLQGTEIPEAVDKDLANIQKEYNDIILPFIRSHTELWDPEKHTLELYKSLVAFVMAYSFQEPLQEEEEDDQKEPNPPMMVPMADILNHVSNHNANLEYSPEHLKMVSVRHIKKGEEVFNTYGQMANWQLLHMYGFVEPYPNNTDDTADIQMVTIYKAALQAAQANSERELVEEKWRLLCQLEMVGDEGVFIFGQSGSLTDEELYTTLKVLCMAPEEFEEFKENEGWEEAEEDEEEKMVFALSNEGIPDLNPAWKQLLHDSALLTLTGYSADLKSDKELLDNQESYSCLSSREKVALQVRYGQKMILHQLLELTHCNLP